MPQYSAATLERVINRIAETTRYPKEILTAEADLEIDLGIDSVKRLEVTIAIGKEFQIPMEEQVREPWVKTIGDVAGWVEELQKKQQVAPNPPVLASSKMGDSIAIPPSVREPAKPSPMASIRVDASDSRHAIHRPHALPSPQTNRTSNSFQNKIAFITGSGHGVGKVIARQLAKEGMTVIVNSFHSRALGEETVHEIESSGGSAVHFWGSIANPVHVESIFAQIEARFGRLDYLICNASDGKIGSFLELSAEDWDRAFRTNVSGHYHCALKASKLMNLHGGRIITMSAVGSNGYIDGLGSQGVVKAAVETLTKYLACELGPLGIRVNCVAGGPIYGDLLSKFPDSVEAQNHWESFTPDGELCDPTDVANTILFLLSDAASGVNGAVWSVDHGFSAVSDGRSSRRMTSNSRASKSWEASV